LKLTSEDGTVKKAKQIPAHFKKSVVYQMFLRPFTPDGTLRSAERLLPFLADLGFDMIYLCPIFEADGDTDPAYWSDRQRMSGLDNPKNPYRMSDYFTIDSEYGTDDDLHSFITAAHALGLRVMLDLVYLHCGPKAVFLAEHPDFVKRDENGIVYGKWRFPFLNFDSPELREYLWDNMIYYVEQFGVDGYRCDVGDRVPLDFWREGVRRIRERRPDFVMLNEGTNGEFLEDVFDANYCFKWSRTVADVLRGALPASALRTTWEDTVSSLPAGGRSLRCLDNHDTASDSYDDRIERAAGSDGMEAALFLLYAIDGIPMIYNGNEICDTHRHSVFANRFFGAGLVIDWSRALTEEGMRRRIFIRTMNELRHDDGVLNNGTTIWLENTEPDKFITFLRKTREKTALCVINFSRESLSARVSLPGGLPDCAKAIVRRNVKYRTGDDCVTLKADPFGYLLLEC